MGKKISLGIIIIFLLAATLLPIAHAQQIQELQFVFIDSNGSPIKDLLVHIETSQDNRRIGQYDRYAADSTTSIRLRTGKYLLTFLAKSPGSDSFDLYSETTLDTTLVSGPEQIVLTTASTIRITTRDESNTLLPGTGIRMECTGMTESRELITNGYGIATMRYPGKGDCHVFASYGNLYGNSTISINETKEYEISITLNQRIQQANYWMPLIIAALALATITFLVTKRNKNKPEPKQEARRNFDDVLPVLDPVDKKVMEALIAEKGEATQSNLRSLTRIPKTTLFRSINKLEAKGLIETTKIGKMKKIRLKR